MKKEIIRTEKAPAAVGPYSQAIKAGNIIYVSGQIPIEPKTGKVITGGIEDEVRQALKNLEEIIIAGGSSLDRVIKTTVFLTDMNDFTAMNRIYSEYFTSNQPARACVEVTRLPKDVHFEIEAIAIAGE